MRPVNPATEEPLLEYAPHNGAQVERFLTRATGAFEQWRRTPLPRRAEWMKSAAHQLRVRINELARLMTTEMGKPITASAAEVEKCAWCCDWFADNAQRLLEPRTVATDAQRSYVRYDPLGAVLAIMPWNFPLWQVFRFAAPALMAGNVGLLKHASNVPGCALAIEQVFTDAGFPRGAFTTLLIDNKAAQELIGNRAIAAVTLTGSESAGRAVGSAAGKALKKSVLELGGSDPFIVLADADVEPTARAAAAARCINSGQSCIAAKRFVVDRRIVEQFTTAMVEAMRGMKVGDPLDRATAVGPLAREDLLNDLHDQVQRSIRAGGRLLCGGKRLARKGWFYEPTVLADVLPGMAAFDEETFGPVAAVVTANDEEHGIELANRSPFGLGASIWTHDLDRAQSLAGRIESGCVFVNEAVKSDPRLPFGGVKNSGYGRELADVGLHEFVNIKTVWVKAHEDHKPATRSE